MKLRILPYGGIACKMGRVSGSVMSIQNPNSKYHAMTPSIELNAITSAIISAVADVERIYLFGSRAREDARADSDYDIYIVLPNEGVRQGEAVENVYRSLLANTPYNKPVDIVAGYAATFDRRKTLPTLERVITREGVLLYERK